MADVDITTLGAVIKAAYEGEANTNAFTDAEKSKLSGIEADAQVNTVTSVAGKTGAVTLAKGDVGLGNVDNTSDVNKPVSTAVSDALSGKVSSDPSGVTGADAVVNIISLTTAEYAAIVSPDAATLYIITDAE